MSHGVVSLTRGLVIVLCALMSFSSASAQDDVMMQAGPVAQPLSRRSVEGLSAPLRLDAEQVASVRVLYAGYRSKYKQLVQAGGKEIAAFRKKLDDENRHDDADRKLEFKITHAFVVKQDSLEKSFLSDLKAMLRPEQAAHFVRAERARRREVGFRFAFVAGESADLVQALGDLQVDRDSSPDLADAIERYEVAVDRIVVARDKIQRDFFLDIDRFEDSEPAKLVEGLFTRLYDNGCHLRDIHREYAQMIGLLLPADKRTALDREVGKRSFPLIYAETFAGSFIKAAKALADLSAEQTKTIAAIADSYTQEADAINSRWAKDVEAKQARIVREISMWRGRDEEGPDDPLAVARAAREALDERVTNRVIQALDAKQLEQLPRAGNMSNPRQFKWLPRFDDEAHSLAIEWLREDYE